MRHPPRVVIDTNLVLSALVFAGGRLAPLRLAWQGQQLTQPCLFIGGSRDPATTLFGAVEDPVAMMRMFAPKVEGHVLDGVGHWTQQERPEEVNALLLDWLRRL